MSASTKASRLLPFFTTALQKFQHSKNTFAVLCSVTATTTPADELSPPSPLRSTPLALLVLDSSFNPPTVAHRRMVLSALSNNVDKYVKKATAPSRVLLLLAINNADKAPKPAAFPERLAMMYIFAEDLLLSCQQVQQLGENSMSTSSTSGLDCSLDGIDIAVTTEPYFHDKAAAVQHSGFYYVDSPSASTEEKETRTDQHQQMEQVYLTGFDTLIRIFNSKYYPGQDISAVLGPFFAHSSLRVTMRTAADWGDAAAQRQYLDDLRGGRLDEMGGKGEWMDKISMAEGRREGEDVVSSTRVRDAVRSDDWERLGRLTSTEIAEWVREHKLYEE